MNTQCFDTKSKLVNFTLVFLLIFILVGIFPANPIHAQTTLYVDANAGNCSAGDGTPVNPFCTIQEAVDAASAGDIISVAAGNYTGNVRINKALTLLGAQAGVDARGRSGAESLVTAPGPGPLEWSAFNVLEGVIGTVTIDGFSVKGKRGTIRMQGFTSRFLNNIVYAFGDQLGQPAALVFIAGDATDVVVQYNDVSPSPAYDLPSGCNGIYISVTGAANVLVDNNHIHNASDNPGALGAGLALFANDPNATLTVTNNVMEWNGSDGMFTGDSTFGTLNISHNDIHDNFESGITITGNVTGAVNVNCNNIYDNGTYGLLNESSITVDATNNWWGCSDGPGSPGCSNVTGNVTYTPWIEGTSGSSASILTATGTGNATFTTDVGGIANLTAVDESTLPSEGKPNMAFPHGFFAFEVCCVPLGQTVTMSIQLPWQAQDIVEYWKYGPTPGDSSDHWYQIPMTYYSAINTVTITLVDGGLGDDDLTADGVIIDQGGPAYMLQPPSAPTSMYPEYDAVLVTETDITFQWNPSPGADKYFLAVSTKNNPYNESGRKFFAEVGDVTQYTDTGYSNNCTRYYWWVWAGNSYGWCPESQVLANSGSFLNKIHTPLPIAPDDDAVVNGTSVDFQWEEVAGANTYFLAVSTKNDPYDASGHKFYDQVGNVTEYTDTGYTDDGTYYYWWVWAGNGNGWSCFSEVDFVSRTFRNGDYLSAPVLISPADDAWITSSNGEVTFEWDSSTGANTYFLIVSTKDDLIDFNSYKFCSEVGNVTQYADTGYSKNCTRYYWWVWAGNGDGGWSPGLQVLANRHSFLNRIDAPSLTLPADEAVIYGTSVDFQWTAVAGANTYFLSVSTSDNLLDINARKFFAEVGDVTEYTDTGYPDLGDTYYWRVWAGNGNIWSCGNEVAANGRTFVNGDPPPPPPDAPVLISPADDAWITASEVTFEWNPSPGADTYFLAVSTKDDPYNASGRKYFSEVGNVTEYTDTGYSNNCTRYYWWVWAGNSGGWSPYSQVQENRHIFLDRINVPTLISPADDAVVNDTSINFQWEVVTGANTYFLAVSTKDDPYNANGRKFFGAVGNVAEYTVTGFPNNGTYYNWWVWAGNGNGWSCFTEVDANSRTFRNG